MSITTNLNGSQFAQMIVSGTGNLEQHKQQINDLNVFPVPDGDTGDNMYMTISSGISAIKSEETSLSEVSSQLAQGMLLGARGNSGVILSRIFSGLSKGLKGYTNADPELFVQAMKLGIDESYGSVAHPVEGTILTVWREAVETVAKSIPRDFISLFETLLSAMQKSLSHTPELLPVLMQAGVVDSGGAGLSVITEGILLSLSGKSVKHTVSPTSITQGADFSSFTENSVLEYGYCTEFLLRLQNSKIPGGVDCFREKRLFDFINSIGDSVVAFRNGSIIKVHVHTFKPGDILNECRKYGEFLTVKIENMSLQHNETITQNQSINSGFRFETRKRFATVAVANGEGLKNLFREIGTDEIIDGGQSMNPSAADFISAFDRLNSDCIFVFPNNGNIILAAQQAASLYSQSDIRIIPTKTIGQGYASMSMFNPELGNADEIEADLIESFKGVKTGIVAKSSRSTQLNGIMIEKNSYLGYEGDTVLCSQSDRISAAESLCDKLEGENYDVIIVIKGSSPSTEEAEKLTNNLTNKYKHTEVILTSGDQPIYDYIIIFE